MHSRPDLGRLLCFIDEHIINLLLDIDSRGINMTN